MATESFFNRRLFLALVAASVCPLETSMGSGKFDLGPIPDEEFEFMEEDFVEEFLDENLPKEVDYDRAGIFRAVIEQNQEKIPADVLKEYNTIRNESTNHFSKRVDRIVNRVINGGKNENLSRCYNEIMALTLFISSADQKKMMLLFKNETIPSVVSRNSVQYLDFPIGHYQYEKVGEKDTFALWFSMWMKCLEDQSFLLEFFEKAIFPVRAILQGYLTTEENVPFTLHSVRSAVIIGLRNTEDFRDMKIVFRANGGVAIDVPKDRSEFEKLLREWEIYELRYMACIIAVIQSFDNDDPDLNRQCMAFFEAMSFMKKSHVNHKARKNLRGIILKGKKMVE